MLSFNDVHKDWVDMTYAGLSVTGAKKNAYLIHVCMIVNGSFLVDLTAGKNAF